MLHNLWLHNTDNSRSVECSRVFSARHSDMSFQYGPNYFPCSTIQAITIVRVATVSSSNLRPKGSIVLIDLLWKIGSNMCGKGNGSHVCSSTYTRALHWPKTKPIFWFCISLAKVRAAVSTQHFEHILSPTTGFIFNTTNFAHPSISACLKPLIWSF